MKIATLLLAAALAPRSLAPGAGGEPPPRAAQPVEVGLVTWGRDFEGALQRSAESGRPVFVLFQEVPGCSGCRQFGREVLSHPVVVEAVEKEFIPLLVYNNRPGRDAELRERFGEPAWNYQVVRFLDGAGRDVIPRRDRVWSLGGVASRMVEALAAAGRKIPLALLALAEREEAGD